MSEQKAPALTPHEAEVVKTFRAFLDAEAAASEAKTARDAIVNRTHRELGVSVRMLSPYLREVLARGGLTDDEILAAGTSEGNVKAILRGD
jgi:hypothetical protein